MIFNAQEFSHYETCPRLTQIKRIYHPPQWPIREATKQFLERGIRGIFSGTVKPEDIRQEFIDHGAKPGFTYPGHAEPYTLANDYADWLEGALSLCETFFTKQYTANKIGVTENGAFNLLPLFEVGPYKVHIEAWQDETGVIHIIRAKPALGERNLFWPEIALLGFTDKEIIIHHFRLPSVREGRLISPLCMAYKHPTFNINLRLSRMYDEPEFNKNWKKIARWEVQPKIEWPEWYRGIERDQCLDKIYERFTISPILDAQERKKILYDVEHLCSVMEKPHLWPRFREACQNCVFSKLCHGNEEARSQYKIASPEALAAYENKLSSIS